MCARLETARVRNGERSLLPSRRLRHREGNYYFEWLATRNPLIFYLRHNRLIARLQEPDKGDGSCGTDGSKGRKEKRIESGSSRINSPPLRRNCTSNTIETKNKNIFYLMEIMKHILTVGYYFH